MFLGRTPRRFPCAFMPDMHSRLDRAYHCAFMVAERVGRPVRPEIHCPGPVGRAAATPAQKNSRPMSWAGAGVTNTQEEEQGTGSSEPTPGGSPSAPPLVGEESPAMPLISSASESSSPVTRRDLHRAKRGLRADRKIIESTRPLLLLLLRLLLLLLL